MPGGVPVATVALNGAKNAGILALQMLSISNKALQEKIIQFKDHMEEEVREKAIAMNKPSFF
jgi:5-(carboxyamino)imidazole ribonucleotide mutase